MSNWKNKYNHVYSFKNGFGRVKLNGKFGFVNKKGEEICIIKYDWVDDFRNGFAAVEINKNFGFINEQGEEMTMELNWIDMEKCFFDFTQTPYYKKYLMMKIIKDLENENK